MTKDLRLYFYRKKPTNTYSITVNRLSNICQRSLPIASSVCRTYPGVISVLWDTQIYNGLQVHLMNLFFLDVEKLIWHLLLQRFRSKERNNVWRKQECVLSSAGNYQWLKRNGRGKRGDIFYDLFSVSVGKIWLETVLYFLTERFGQAVLWFPDLYVSTICSIYFVMQSYEMKNILNITITNLKQYRIYLKQNNYMYHLPVDLSSELRTLAISVTLDNKLTRVQPYIKMLIKC